MKHLFVSDLDGTLLNKNGELSANTVNILNKAIDEGLQFTISTARTPTTALKIVEPLHLNLPIMLMNGVLIYDIRKKNYQYKAVMDETVVMVLLGMIKMKGLNCFLYSLQDDQFNAYYDSADSVSLNYFRNERVMKYDKKFTEVEDLTLVTNKDIIYCMLREPKEKLEALYRELSVVKGVKADFYKDIYSDDYYMLEIYSDRASKKNALEYIRKEEKYDFITSFGDNLNDMSLKEASNAFYCQCTSGYSEYGRWCG